MKNIFSLFQIISIGLFLFSCSPNGKTDEKDSGLTKKSNESSAFSEEASTKSSSSSKSENYQSNDTLDLKLTPFIPDYPDLGGSGKRLLSSRLNLAVSNYAFGGEGGNPRFIIGPDITLLSKNITATSPTKYANTYEVTLLSLDVVSETTFASYSFTVKGVGDTPSKAFINAFRDYTFETEDFFNFLKKTQVKIAKYYNNNCDKIILEAESEAEIRNYDNAFALLKSVPTDASNCFKQVMDKKQEFFQLSLNTNCEALLSKMKAELGKSNDPSASGFNEEAMSYYALIDANADCKSEAEKIYQGYLKNLNPKAKREWEQEQRAFEAEIAKSEREDNLKMEKVTAKYNHDVRMQELKTEAEIKGNKKLLEKYQYDQLPWLRKVFHLGKNDPFDNIND